MDPVPPFRGIRKLADSPSESKGILQTFDNFRICRYLSLALLITAKTRIPISSAEEAHNIIHDFMWSELP
jgi:hypothetical protein